MTVLLVSIAMFPTVLAAQLAPSLGYVDPPVITIGQTTDVRMGGFDFTEDMQWFVHNDALKFEILGPRSDYHLPPPPYWVGPRASTNAFPIPREVPARITVSPDAKPGLVRWQVANANGASETACFYLSPTVPVMETRSRDLPQQISNLPVDICGRLSRLTEVDRYEFVADRDGPVSIEIMARQLGVDFQAVLQVHDSHGTKLADFADTLGQDGGLTFLATAGETYTLSLNDVDFRGDRSYVYRLSITPGPRVTCSIPARCQRGTTQEVEFIGPGLNSGTGELESIRQTVTFPDDSDESLSVEVLTRWGAVAFAVPLIDSAEPTRDEGRPILELTSGMSLTERMIGDADERSFSWNAAKDEWYTIDAESLAIGGSLDVALRVIGPDGKQVAELDDLPDSTDSRLHFKIPADGRYQVVIRCMSDRVGRLDEICRVALVKTQPDFAITLPQTLTLPSGGKVEVKFAVARLGGFAEPIQVEFKNLPEGVTPVGDLIIPGDKSELRVSLECAADVAVTASMIQVQGTAPIDGQPVTHLATATLGGSYGLKSLSEKQTTNILLAMTMSAPFEIKVVDRERQRDVPRGTTSLAELDIERKEGFTGEIMLEMDARQSRNRQGILGFDTLVAPGESKAWYPCFLPEWLGTDLTRRIVIHGVAKVPDPKGNIRELTQKGDARITMILEGALLKLSCPENDLQCRIGSTFEVPVNILRSVKFPKPVTVDLEIPDELQGILSPEPMTLEPEAESGRLRVHSTTDPKLTGQWTFRVRATARQDDRWPVVSEAELNVEFMN
ncbi:MAG: PPC domain-containing protein [Planctomycetaceae bacterium]